ncbi:MAG: hypothetical protein ACR2M0_08520 [Chloroflexia bacterium]
MTTDVTADEKTWEGFQPMSYTPVPDELFDYWLPRLSEAEMKVLLYIMRRTCGFRRDADDISLNQMTHGIVTREGNRLDCGAGLSESGAKKGIKGLTAKGLITRYRNQSPHRGYEPTTYRLVLRASPDSPDTPVASQRPGAGVTIRLREGSRSAEGEGSRSAEGLGHNSPIQETVVQETEYKKQLTPPPPTPNETTPNETTVVVVVDDEQIEQDTELIVRRVGVDRQSAISLARSAAAHGREHGYIAAQVEYVLGTPGIENPAGLLVRLVGENRAVRRGVPGKPRGEQKARKDDASSTRLDPDKYLTGKYAHLFGGSNGDG